MIRVCIRKDGGLHREQYGALLRSLSNNELRQKRNSIVWQLSRNTNVLAVAHQMIAREAIAQIESMLYMRGAPLESPEVPLYVRKRRTRKASE